MGQYQQWLHYREVDQHLQAQLEVLVRELVQLQEHAHLLEQSIQPLYESRSVETSSTDIQECLQADNPILHALATSLNERHSPMESTKEDTPIPTPLPQTTPNRPAETISPALFGWSNLPNFRPQQVPVETAKAGNASPFSNTSQPQLPLPTVPHSDMGLLPEDMATFFDQHDQTEPRLELPPWLRNAINRPDGPIDQETIRTNRLVQRWIERWNRYPQQSVEAGEDS